MKTCCKCKQEKELENFSIRKTGTPTSECKSCAKKRSNEWYWKNREKSIEDRKKYYQENREESLKKWKERYLANYDEIRKKANARNRTDEQREKSRIRTNLWNANNREKLRAKGSKWKKEHPEQSKAYQYVLWGVKLGVLKKPLKCERCSGLKKLEAHHEDYAKPLEVVWLCKICHENEHHKDDHDFSTSS
jgi:hypothetical protein